MRAKGILSETMRRAIKGMQARPATPAVRRAMCASLAGTRGNTPQDGPWYLKEGWANAKNWKEPAAGAEAYVTERTPYGGTFFRLPLYQILKQTTRSGVPLPLFKQMFGETTTQAVVDVRCEVDGQKVPISQHTSGKLSDQATSCQAVLTYNPTSTSRRNVTVPQGVLSNKFMAGKALLGWKLEPASSSPPQLVAVLRTVTDEEELMLETSGQGGVKLGVSVRREGGSNGRGPGRLVFDIARPQPQFVGKNAAGISVPKQVIDEALVKEGLIDLEPRMDDDGGFKRSYIAAYIPVKLEGSVTPQHNKVHQAALHLYFDKAGRYAKARMTCIPPKANGLVNKVITTWTKELGQNGVLTLNVEEP